MKRKNQPSHEDGSRPRMKMILTVIHDAVLRELLHLVIPRRTSYLIVSATTGSEAIAFSQDVVPDLMLLDDDLPDSGVIELYDRLHSRKELRNVPTIIMSDRRPNMEIQIKQRGLVLLEKPFDPVTFVYVIERAMGNRKA
jgi:CheY-like chemotaxis protein